MKNIVFLFTAIIMLVHPMIASAETYTFNQSINSDWNNLSNWSWDGEGEITALPSENDNVVIPEGTTVKVNFGPIVVNNLTVNSKLLFDKNYDYIVNGNFDGEGFVQFTEGFNPLFVVKGENNYIGEITYKIKPETLETFYSSQDGNWSDYKSWSIEEGKKEDILNVVPTNENVYIDHIIRVDKDADLTGNLIIRNQLNSFDKKLNVTGEISGNGSLFVASLSQIEDHLEDEFFTSGNTYINGTYTTYYSTQNGSYDDECMWGVVNGKRIYRYDADVLYGGPGDKAENIVVKNGTTVEISSSKNIKNIEIEEGGKLIISGEGTTLTTSATLVVNGTLSIIENAKVTLPSAGMELSGVLEGDGYLVGIINGEGENKFEGIQTIANRPDGALTFYSINDGDWENAATWSIDSEKKVTITGVYPKDNDNVVIRHNVNMTKNVSPNDVIVEENSSWTTGNFDVTIKGALKLDGSILNNQSVYKDIILSSYDKLTIGENASSTAFIRIPERPTEDILTFYTVKRSSTADETYWTYKTWSIHKNVKVILYLNGDYYYPTKDNNFIDNVVITNGQTINANISNVYVNSVNDFVIDEGATLKETGGYEFRIFGKGLTVKGQLYLTTENPYTSTFIFAGVEQTLEFTETSTLYVENEKNAWYATNSDELTIVPFAGKILGKGIIRVPYEFFVDKTKYASFADYLEDPANSELANFIDRDGTILFTSRPNDTELTFYLKNDTKIEKEVEVTKYWTDADSNSKTWTIIDGKNVYLLIDGGYYYPSKTVANKDIAVIHEGQTIYDNISLTLAKIVNNGNVIMHHSTTSRSFTWTLTGDGSKMSSTGKLTIPEEYKLTINKESKIAFEDGAIVEGVGTLWANPNLIGYDPGKVGDGNSAAIEGFVEGGATVVLTERPTSEYVTFYYDNNAEKTWTTNELGMWSLVDGKKVYLYTNRYMYPGANADNKDNAVIGEGKKVQLNIYSTYLRDLEVSGQLTILTNDARTSSYIMYVTDAFTLNSTARMVGNGLETAPGRIKLDNYTKFGGTASESPESVLNNVIIYVTEHTDGPMTFYARKNSANWTTTYEWSLNKNADIFLMLNDAYYWPGTNALYVEDNIVIPAGKEVFLNTSIYNNASVGDFTVEEGGTFNQYYMTTDGKKGNAHFRILGKATLTGKVNAPVDGTGRSNMYISKYAEIETDWETLGIVNSGEWGNILVTEIPEGDLTFYAHPVGANTYWSSGRAWVMNHEGKEIYLYPNESWYHPGKNEVNRDAAVIPEGMTMIMNSHGKTLRELTINGRLAQGGYKDFIITGEVNGNPTTPAADGVNTGDDAAHGVLTMSYKTYIHAYNGGFTFYDNDKTHTYLAGNPYTHYSNCGGEVRDWKFDYDKGIWRAHQRPDKTAANVYYFPSNDYYYPRSSSDTVTISAGDYVKISDRLTYTKVVYVEGTLEICRTTEHNSSDVNEDDKAWLFASEVYVRNGGKIIMCESARISKDTGTGLEKLVLEEGGVLEAQGDGIIMVQESGYDNESPIAKVFMSQGGIISIRPKTTAGKYYSNMPVDDGVKVGYAVNRNNWSLDEDLTSNVYAFPGINVEDEMVVMPNQTVMLNGGTTYSMMKSIEIRENAILKTNGQPLTVTGDVTFIDETSQLMLSSGRVTVIKGNLEGNGILTLYSWKNMQLDGENHHYGVGETRMLTKPFDAMTFYSNYSGNWLDADNSRWEIEKGKKVYLYNATAGYISPGYATSGLVDNRNADNVVIRSGNTIDLNADVYVTNLTIEEGATLNVCGCKLYVRGDLVVNGTLDICEGATVTVYGNITTTGNDNLSGKGTISAPKSIINKDIDPGKSFTNQGGKITNTAEPSGFRYSASGSKWSDKNNWTELQWNETASAWEVKQTPASRYPNGPFDYIEIPAGYEVIQDRTINASTLVINGVLNSIDSSKGDINVSGDLEGTGTMTIHCMAHLHIGGENKFFKTGVTNALSVSGRTPLIFYSRNIDGQPKNWTDDKPIWSVDKEGNLFWYRLVDDEYKYFYPYQNGGSYTTVVTAGNEITVDDDVVVASLELGEGAKVNVCGGSLTVNGMTVVGKDAEIHICQDATKMFACPDFIELHEGAKITGDGMMRIASESRFKGPGDEEAIKSRYADFKANGELLLTSRLESIQTFYSMRDGDWMTDGKWEDTEKMWQAEPDAKKYFFTTHEVKYMATEPLLDEEGNVKKDDQGNELTHEVEKTRNEYYYYYPQNLYNDRVVVRSGHTLTLTPGDMLKIRDLTVEAGGRLEIKGRGAGVGMGDTLRVYQDALINGIVTLCNGAVLKTNKINGTGALYMPKAENLLVTYDSYNTLKTNGEIFYTGLTEPVAFYSRNVDSQKWEDYKNWVINENGNYYAYFGHNECDLGDADDYYYPGKYNATDTVVVRSGDVLNLDHSVTLNKLTIDGTVIVGEEKGDEATGTYITVNGDVLGSEEGKLVLEYVENVNIIGSSEFFNIGTVVIKHHTEGKTYYLKNTDGEWTDYENWTLDPTTFDFDNPEKRYPGQVMSDKAVIPVNKNVTVDKNVVIAGLEISGKVMVPGTKTSIAISNETSGSGELVVSNLAKNYIMLDNAEDGFLKNGTVTITSPTIIPTAEYGTIVVDFAASDEDQEGDEEEEGIENICRIVGDIKINKNLIVKQGSELVLGKDIDKIYYYLDKLRSMAKEGQNLPSEYDVFINVKVDGNIEVEEGATLRGASILKSVRSGIINNIGLPSWSNIDLGGDLTVKGTVDFALPDNGYGYNGSWAASDRKVTVHFVGDKEAKLFVENSGLASFISIVCDKSVNTELNINKESDGQLYFNGRIGLSDYDHSAYSIVLNSGTMRLGSGIEINGWGCSRYDSNGKPQGNLEYDIWSYKSNMALYHANTTVSADIDRDLRRMYEGSYTSGYNIKLELSKTGLTEGEYYLNGDKTKTTLDGYSIFKAGLEGGLVIPKDAKLIIDGATVNLGRSNTSGYLQNDGYMYGHVELRGALEVTNNGVLNFPDYSVGIIYDAPDGPIAKAAELTISKGGVINVSRIYGLHNRKLSFKMSGDESQLNFTVPNNSNTNLYDEYYTRYGNGDIAQGKAQGCVFSMANGGTFEMEGGLIFFNNYERATSHTINGWDLNNCEGSISGGEIRFQPTSTFNVFMNNISLNDVSVYGGSNVTFYGDHNDATTMGFYGNKLEIKGGLRVDKAGGRMRVPENLYVGGNIFIRQREGVIYNSTTYTDEDVAQKYTEVLADKSKPFYASYESAAIPSPNLYVTGNRDSYIEVPQESSSYPSFNSLTIRKDNPTLSLIIKGRPLHMWGDLTIDRGHLLTETEPTSEDYPHNGDSEDLDGVIFGSVSTVKNNQTITVSDEGDMSDATLSFWINTSYNVILASDVTVKNFNAQYQRKVILDGHEFKVLDKFYMPTKNSARMFVNTSDVATGGLTIKVDANAGDVIEMPVGLRYTNTNNVITYSYTPCVATCNEKVSGYLTVAPCNNYHPFVKDQTTATKLYFKVKWTDDDGFEASNNAFSYDFTFPAFGTISDSYTKTSLISCRNNKSHSGHTDAEIAEPEYYYYSKFYQYYDNQWWECGRLKTSITSGHAIFPSGVDYAGDAYTLPYHSGDFTDGYHFDTNVKAKTFYSCKDGEWNDPTTWTKNSDFTPDDNEELPTKIDNVVIGNNNNVTTNSVAKIQAGKVTINAGSSLDIAKSTSKNYVGMVLGEGTLIYNVDPEKDWVKRIATTNYLQGDHSGLCGEKNASIVFRNDEDKVFTLPKMVEYPNLVLEGKVQSTAEGIKANGSIIVKSGEFNLGCAQGKNVSVAGDIVVYENAKLNTTDDATVTIKSKNISNNGNIILGRSVLELSGNIANEGRINVDGPINFVSNTNAVVNGNGEIEFDEHGVLQLNKDIATNHVDFEMPMVSVGDYMLADLVKGTINIDNASTDVKVRTYRNGQLLKYFDMPENVTINVKAGRVIFDGDAESTLRLGGSLTVSNDAIVETTNGLGYISGGTSKLNLNDKSTLKTTQISPFGSTGSIDLNQNASTVKLILKEGTTNETYSVLDIREGSFKQANNAKITISNVAEGSTAPTVYFNPTVVSLGTGSSFVFDASGKTATMHTTKAMQSIAVKEGTELSVVNMPLTMNSTLTVDGKLTMNGNDLTLNSNAAFNGEYVAGENTTYLAKSGQVVSGTVEFYNLTKNSLGTSTIDATAIVGGTLDVMNGVLDMPNTELQVSGKSAIIGLGTSLTGKGLKMCGSSKQSLQSEGTITILNIDNVAGVDASAMQTNALKISEKLILSDGVLTVGGNKLELASGVTIVDGDGGYDFGLGKMIVTNMVMSDGGIIVNMPNKQAVNLILPIGSAKKYAPMTFNNVKVTSSNGTFSVIPVDGYYIGVPLEAQSHALKQYWMVKSDKISGFSGSISTEADITAANGYNHDVEEDGVYISAAYFEGSIEWSKTANEVVDVDELNHKVTMTYKEIPPLTGYYMAGCFQKIPFQVKSYISVVDGNWKDAIWREYDIKEQKEVYPESDPIKVSDAELMAGAIVINSMVTITQSGKKVSSMEIREGAMLNVGSTLNHYLGVLRGKGTLKLSTGNMPAGNYDEFIAPGTGTIEYGGSKAISISQISFNNVIFSGSSSRTFNTDRPTTIYGNLTINDKPTVNAEKNIVLHGDIAINGGSLKGDGLVQFSGEQSQMISNTTGKTISLGGIQIDNASGVAIENTDVTLTKKLILTNGILSVEEGHKVTVSGILEGGSADSYVSGMLGIKYPTSGMSCFFPVGLQSYYAPVNFTNVSADTYYVQYKQEHADVEDTHVHNGLCSTLGEEYWIMASAGKKKISNLSLPYNENSVAYNASDDICISYLNNKLDNTNKWTKVDSYQTETLVTTVSELSFTLTNISSGCAWVTFGKKSVNDFDWVGHSSDWNDPNNWRARRVPSSSDVVYIDGSVENYPIISDGQVIQVKQISLYNDKTISNPGKITIDGGTLYVTSDIRCLDNNDSYIFINQRYDKVSNLRCNTIKNGPNAAAGIDNMTRVNRFFKPNILYYVGSATIEGTITDDSDEIGRLASYDVNSQTYVPSDKFAAKFVGASVGLRGETDRRLSQVGSIQTAKCQFTLYNNSGYNDGWNLISNPYQMAFDLTKYGSKITVEDGIEPSVWYRSYTDGGYVWTAANIKTAVSVSQGSAIDDANSTTLAPQQAFFTFTNVRGKKFTFNPVTSLDEITSESGLKASRVVDDVLRLTVSSDEALTDEMALVFRDGGTMEANSTDSHKYLTSSTNETHNGIYAVKSGDRYSIPLYPAVSEMNNELVPLGVRLSNNSTRGTITATNIDEFDHSVDVYLYDYLTNEYHNLRSANEVAFDGNAGRYVDNRFAIVLKSLDADNDVDDGDNVTTLSPLASTYILITGNDNNEAVVSMPSELVAGAQIRVYDVLGHLVSSVGADGTITKVKLGEAKGIYLVEVISGTNVKSAKIRSKN